MKKIPPATEATRIVVTNAQHVTQRNITLHNREGALSVDVLSAQSSGSSSLFSIEWEGEAGKTYQVETTTDPVQGQWTLAPYLSAPFQPNTQPSMLTGPMRFVTPKTSSTRFWRVFER